MLGAPSTYTDAGPPEKMMPLGSLASISAIGIDRGTISEWTCASRTRRAISCAYCAPKSTTRIVSNGAGSGAVTSAASPAHADALGTLERLPLRLERGGDHHFRLLELLERLVAGGGHRRAQGAAEIEGAVVLVRGPDEDLGERGPVA